MAISHGAAADREEQKRKAHNLKNQSAELKSV
jgi:hypothetical protein